jgi:hypothetical protein
MWNIEVCGCDSRRSQGGTSGVFVENLRISLLFGLIKSCYLLNGAWLCSFKFKLFDEYLLL